MQPSGGGSSSSPPASPCVKDSLHTLHGQFMPRNHLAKEAAERQHRRYSLQDDSFPVNGYGWKPLDDAFSDTERRSSLQAKHQDQKRRNSISIVPSNGTGHATSEIRRSMGPSHSRTPSSFPASLPIEYERQAQIDLETFRLERACGMTLDTISVSKPRALQLNTTERECAMEDFGNQLDSECPGTRKPRQKEKSDLMQARSRPHSLFECPSRYESLIIPTASSTPVSPSSPSFARKLDTSPRPHRPAPPFSPSFEPHKQLALVDAFIKVHQDLFSTAGLLTAAGPVTVQNVIDVERLLKEHELDAQLERLRSETERGKGGLPFFEKFSKAQENESWGNDASWRTPMAMVDMSDAGYRVFGQSLTLTRMYASCVCSMAGYQHDLPIVVCACVEELYRTGMTVAGLFRSPPNRERHNELIELFDNGPSFGRSRLLNKEDTADICALLRSYIDRLPHAIWHETLFDPMFRLCVLPSVLMEKAIAEASEDDEATGEVGQFRNKIRALQPSSLISPVSPLFGRTTDQHARSSSFNDVLPISDSLSSSTLSAMALAEIDILREKPQIAAVRAFFRLLPRAQLALLAYLCAFFSQLPLSSHNQLAIEDLARLFAVPLFLGKVNGVGLPLISEAWAVRKDEARMMMVWVLRRWTHISDGLFDVEDDSSTTLGTEDDLTSATSFDDSESVKTVASSCAPGDNNGSGSQTAASNAPYHLGAVCGRSEGLQGLANDLFAPLPPRVNSERMDIVTWKNHVENDIDELRRALIEVRSRLEQ